VDDELHKKFSQSKCAKLSLSSAAGDKAEDTTGMQLLYHYAIDIARFLQLLKWNGFRILASCEAACSTVVAQDHRRPCLPRRRCKSLEHAVAGDHVTTVTGGIQARTEDGTVP